MYYSQFLKSFLILSLLITNLLSIELKGTIFKISNEGKKEFFIFENFYLDNNKSLMATTDKNGIFSLPYEYLSTKIGTKIKLEIANKDDWFIFKPFKGELVLSKLKSERDIEILIISKKSEMYLNLFTKVHDYTIQVLSTRDKHKAQEKVNSLRKYCQKTKNTNKNIKGKFKKPYYCRKYVKYITKLEGDMPNKYIFNVYYNIYRSKKEAEKDLKIIRSFKTSKDAWIKPLVKVKED